MSSIKNNQYIPEIIGYNPVQEVGSITNIYPETIPEHDISYGYDNQSLDSGVALRNLGRSAYKTQIVRTKTASYTITLSDYTIL